MRKHIEQLRTHSDVISDYIQQSLFSPSNMEYLNKMNSDEEVQMTLPLTIFDDNPNVNSVIVGFRINDEDYGEVEAYYKCVVKDRSKSDLIIIVDIPRHYDKSAEEFIDVELADALGHELQHSCEPPDIMNVKIPEGEEKWKNIESVWRHFGSDVETNGYVTGFFLRSLKLKSRGSDVDPYNVMEDYIVTQIYNKGIGKGLLTQELQTIVAKIFEKWRMRLEYILNAHKQHK